MRKTNRWTLGLVGFALLACMVLLAGCGQDNFAPISPGVGPTDDGSALQYVMDNYGDPFAQDSAIVGGGITPLGKTFKLKEDGDSALIGKDGGTLEMQMRGFKSKLKVPKHALASDVMMSVEGVLFSTPDGEVLLYDFGPDGLVFDLPAELEVDAGQLKDGTTFSLFWWNPTTEHWVFQQQVVVKTHKIKFDIHHFSKYGIS